MAATLRQLLIQRAARLQERPALTAPDWQLTWAAWRNRVEGVALGLLAEAAQPPLHAHGHGPWDWAAEVATACCGWAWEVGGQPVPNAVLGGPSFNADAGRGPYHDQEEAVRPDTPFTAGLTQAALLQRLQAWNRRLGWDHGTTVPLRLEQAGTSEGRAALWCALYAGAHTQLLPEATPTSSRWNPWKAQASVEPLDLAPFQAFWSE